MRSIAGPFGEDSHLCSSTVGVWAHLSNSGVHAGEKEGGPRESE